MTNTVTNVVKYLWACASESWHTCSMNMHTSPVFRYS